MNGYAVHIDGVKNLCKNVRDEKKASTHQVAHQVLLILKGRTILEDILEDTLNDTLNLSKTFIKI